MTSDNSTDRSPEADTNDTPVSIGRGVLLASRYRVGEAIGRGGMSTVYRGYDELLRREVAIKVIDGRAAGAHGSRQEFLGEARAAAALLHPNIAAIYDVGVSGAERYIVMEYVPDGSLLDLIQAQAPLPPARAVDLTTQIADALAYGHRHGIIHCDVKPQNVLLDETGRPKLVDFGISRSITATGALTDTITGTAGYIAPEQLLGERLDGRADIYALGCVAYELLTGALPFESSNLTALATQRLARPPAPLRQKNPRVSPGLAESVMRAIERDPEQRYRSADEFSQALTAALALASPTARTALRPGTAELTRRQSEDLPARVKTGELPRRSQGRTLWPVVLLLLGAVIIAGVVAAIELPSLLPTAGGAVVSVPDVRNQSLTDATRQLHARRLAVDLRLQDTINSGICSGVVMNESPAPNVQVSSGSSIVLEVSASTRC